ncbi:hypothetical protein PLIP_b0024 [Pseudoalteromonas lipolytica LMEB 39]|nr:hypothetical protein [Pseudoalteromonas lipolytica LMEB 39]
MNPFLIAPDKIPDDDLISLFFYKGYLKRYFYHCPFYEQKTVIASSSSSG